MEVLTSEATFFTHKDEFMAALEKLVGTESPEEAKAAVDIVTDILDKYQEQPLLLDRHLEPALTLLMGRVRSVLAGTAGGDESTDDLAALVGDAGGGTGSGPGAFPFQVHTHPTVHRVFQAVYLLCKTRGYKHVVKLMPHEVADLEPALRLLLSQDKAEHDTWETRYVLLLWLSILALVPFDLRTIDSSLADLAVAGGAAGAGAGAGASEGGDGDGEGEGEAPRSTLIESIIGVCKEYLAHSGAVSTAAAVCLARLLTRPDMDSAYLRRFLLWARERIGTDDGGAFLVIGIFTALCQIAKHGHREVLRDCLPVVFDRVVETAGATNTSPLLRKLTVKFAQRVGLTYLPPKVVSWRYQRGQRSLLDNLSATATKEEVAEAAEAAVAASAEAEEEIDVPPEIEDIVEMLLTGLRDKDTVVRWSAAKGVGRLCGRLPLDFADDVLQAVLQLLCAAEGDGAWHGGCLALAELARRGLLLPTRLPDVVPIVVKALTYDVRRGLHSVGAHVRDAACYVCWAFARAYAPAVMHPHVTPLAQGMLTVSVFDREINCRRAASAAFQENVGRQGHDNFPNGITILTAADYFSLGNRTNAYTNVAKTIAQFETYRYCLIDHLVDVKLRHWDVAIRELSAQALAALAPTDPTHFATVVLPKLIPLTLSKELVTRHGATLGVAELVLALGKLDHELSADVQKGARNIVPKVEKARLYRGRGGEFMRAAVCKLIESLGLSSFPLTRRLVLRLLDTLDDCLKHPHDTIQVAAATALKALTAGHLAVDEPAIVDRLPAKHCKLLVAGPNPAVSRGAAMALGALPAGMVGGSPETLAMVLGHLMRATQPKPRADERDAETRRNAVTALAAVVETVGLQAEGVGSGLSATQARRVFATLLLATRDYARDKRGDVGSWVRHQAMLSLERVTKLLLRASKTSVRGDDADAEFVVGDAAAREATLVTDASAKAAASALSGEPVAGMPTFTPPTDFFTPTMSIALTCALLRQLSEKLDLLRGVAGEVLARLVNDPELPMPFVPERQLLRSLFKLPDPPAEVDPEASDGEEEAKGPSTTTADSINWSAPSQCYPIVVKMLKVSGCVEAVVEGLVTSVGGMSESVVKHCSAAFKEWASAQKKAGNFRTLQQVANALVALLKPRCLAEAPDVLPEAFEEAARDSGAGAGASAGAGAGAGNDAGAARGSGAGTAQHLRRRLDARVLVPALRTVNTLLEASLLDDLQEPRSKFATKLLPVVRLRTLKTKRIDRVLAGLDVLVGLVGFKEPVFTKATQIVLELLCHTFPKVRKAAAEKIYVKILTYEDRFSTRDEEEVDIDAALEVLTETPWDADCEVSTLEEKRDALYATLHIPVPDRDALPKMAAGGGGKAVAADELSSYASLVKEMHG